MAMDVLELQIQDNAEQAANGIARLTSTLTSLKSATANNAGLGKIATNLEKIATAARGMNGVNLSKFTTQLSSLNSALAPLQSIAKTNLTGIVNSLGKIPAVTEKLNGANMAAFADAIRQVTAAVQPLATEMDKISRGFSALPKRIQSFITQMERSGKGATTAAKGYKAAANGLNLLNQKFNLSVLVMGMRRLSNILGGFVENSNQYVEDMNLFTVAMGEYADAAHDYAMKAQELMGIDAGQFMRNQGFFMSIASGFGVASDSASLMSQNLAQLGYDLASFYNSDVDTAMQKLQSGLAGELEPLRRWGFALDQITLQETARAHGIQMSIREMNQAQKAQIRYIAIMEQSINAQHDMARTLTTPANAMRVLNQQITLLGRSIGNILIPMLSAILPYAIAAAKVLRMVADAIASLFGFKLPEIDYGAFGDLGGAAGAAGDIDDSLGGAAGNAKDTADQLKRAKDYVLGIDELNILKPEEDLDPNKGGGGGGAGIGGGGGGFDGLDLPEYNFLEGLEKKTDELVEKMKGLLDVVVGIGAALLAWKVAKGVIEVLRYMQGLKSMGLDFSLNFKVLGAVMFLADLKEFMKYFEDFKKNGPTFHNVAGMISEFVGLVGDALILLGNLKLGGALKIIQGIGEIVVAIEDISKNGVDWKNATTAIRGLTNIAIGIGVFTGNIKFAAWGVVIQGFNTIIGELGQNWDAIRQGDWSGVDKVTLIVGGLEILGGLVVALDVFSKLKGIATIGKSAEAMTAVTTATQTLDTAVGGAGGLSSKLASLAKNLGMGLVIVVEVAAAAIIITGAIWVLGKELEQVGLAWQPVIDNGGTIAAAMGIGVGILAAIGVVTALLGSVGTPLIVNIALGTAILALLGVATGLFLIEIWAIGKGLDEIGKAWQPVLDNGETIATGIGLGTALLIGIGVVTAALGVATVASAGLLPLAIGLGTALLVGLAVAVILFIESLVSVANALGNDLAPVLKDLNGKLPGLTTDMSDFVDFMAAFAGEVVRYTGASTVAGLSATIDTIIGWFTADPIKKLSDDVAKTYANTAVLKDNLDLAVSELEQAVDFLSQYANLLAEMESVTSSSSGTSLSNDMFVNLREVGNNLVTGLIEGVDSGLPTFKASVDTLVKDANTRLNEGLSTTKTSPYGKDAVTGIQQGIQRNQTLVVNAAKTLSTGTLQAFQQYLNQTSGHKYGADVTQGIANGISSTTYAAVDAMNSVGSQLSLALANIISNLQQQAAASPINIQMTTTHTVNTVRGSSVRGYATGGVVTSGELFMARENGMPELVGGFGGKTGVMNNDQIVSAVSAGVYEAVSAAMAGKNDDGQPIVIQLDGRTLYESNIKTGKKYGYGGFVNTAAALG